MIVFLKALSGSFPDLLLFVSRRKVLSWAWVARAQRSLLMPQDRRGFEFAPDLAMLFCSGQCLAAKVEHH
jgi:hypothetical protein